MYITYEYNPQSQPAILTLYFLILSLHVSVPTDHLQVTIPTSFVKSKLLVAIAGYVIYIVYIIGLYRITGNATGCTPQRLS
jgi:hypothetical protein